jgi:PilZ domain
MRKVQKMLKAHQADGPRKVVLKGGVIRFQDTHVECFVLNISTGGAGLVVERDIPLPCSFDLEIDEERVRRRCFIVWRNESQIGVSFDPERHPPM